ncbi:hypothetical protein B0H66DRAFT_526736 [Apodospora peruviana]|uniref:Uncharacterized protein n=1 Tax=Apodospora peruviana TaxID=516989 RepID=A0AAE0IQZ4_9PEZI|nr:hypothetical protein B0H66DRAFT_526736 [Apodospora peruviana]
MENQTDGVLCLCVFCYVGISTHSSRIHFPSNRDNLGMETGCRGNRKADECLMGPQMTVVWAESKGLGLEKGGNEQREMTGCRSSTCHMRVQLNPDPNTRLRELLDR